MGNRSANSANEAALSGCNHLTTTDNSLSDLLGSQIIEFSNVTAGVLAANGFQAHDPIGGYEAVSPVATTNLPVISGFC